MLIKALFYLSQKLKNYKPGKMILKHGTSISNYRLIMKEGFKILPKDSECRMYYDNLLGNEVVYLSQLHIETWFLGWDMARMPDYEIVLNVEAEVNKPLILNNDIDLKLAMLYFLSKGMQPLSKDCVCRKEKYYDPSYYSNDNHSNNFVNKAKELGYDAIVIEYDPVKKAKTLIDNFCDSQVTLFNPSKIKRKCLTDELF